MRPPHFLSTSVQFHHLNHPILELEIDLLANLAGKQPQLIVHTPLLQEHYTKTVLECNSEKKKSNIIV